MSKINIESKEIVTTQTVTSIEILEGTIELNSSVKFPVKLLGSNGETINIEFVTIIGEEYVNWGTDDEYIKNLILNKLGLTYSPVSPV
jgi:hypothetical protein